MTDTPIASRPRMQNYGIDPTPEGLITWAWVDERLTASRNYWVASTQPNGLPHAAPVWGVWHDRDLYFGSDRESRKARNFAWQPRVVLHLESGDEVVILEGEITMVEDVTLLSHIGKAFARKYGVDPIAEPMPGAVFFRFTPAKGLTWLENDFPKTATRWTFTPSGHVDSRA